MIAVSRGSGWLHEGWRNVQASAVPVLAGVTGGLGVVFTCLYGFALWQIWTTASPLRDLTRFTSAWLLLLGFAFYGLTAAVLAVVISARTRRVDAQLLALFFGLASLSVSDVTYLPRTAGTMLFGPPAGAAPPIIAVAAAFGLFTIVRFAQHFPEALSAADMRAVLPARAPRLLTVIVAGLLDGRVFWLLALLLAITLATGALTFTLTLALGCVCGSALFTLFYLWSGYRTQDPAGRRAITWIAQAVVAGGVFIVAGLTVRALERVLGIALPNALEPWLLLCGMFSGALFLMFAVFYRGALDPALLVRRTALYGALAPVFVFLFAGIENVATDFLATRLGTDSGIGTWIAAGIIAVVVAAVRRWSPEGRRLRAPPHRTGSQ